MHSKIVTIVGARPQFVKAAAVSLALQKSPKISEIIVHTGQHYDSNMSDIFFSQLGLKTPDYNLNIGSGSHGQQTGRMIEAIEKILLAEKPQLLLIYGDTNSTLAGALAAAKLHIPIAHVEAGLRSFNRKMPEEINRLLSDQLADLLFCPTETAVKNLKNEGIDHHKLFLTGDVMYDAALLFKEFSNTSATILDNLALQPNDFILTTIHRAENTDDELVLRNLINNLMLVAQENTLLFPLHPRTKNALLQFDLLEKAQQAIRFIDPVSFLDMIQLEESAKLIITDSGGVQKEAYFYQTPCITVRDQTEWTELLEKGWNYLIPSTEIDKLSAIVKSRTGHRGEACHLYGQGNASQLIVDQIEHFLFK